MNKIFPVRVLWGVAAVGGATLLGGAAVLRHQTANDIFNDPLAATRHDLAATRQVALQEATPASGGGGAKSAPASREDNSKVAFVTAHLLADSQYLRRPLDKAMSSRLFDRYIDTLDPQKVFFQQADINEFAPLRTEIGAAIYRKGDTTVAQKIFGRLKQRSEENAAFVADALKTQTFTFDAPGETFLLDRKNAARPADQAAAQTLWLQRLRYEYLQEKLNKQKPDKIVETINRRYARIVRTLKEEDADDVFELFMDSLARSYDPHSDFFGKASTENFGITMKLSLFGIGATLQSEDGYVKIAALTPGGPADKSKKLKAGDRIVAVTQGADGGEPVDVVDMKLNRVVEMIRGAKGTIVRLTIWPGGASDPSTRQIVTIKRDEVKLEDQAAKAQIIEMPAGTNGSKTPVRVGVVALPSFYQGENNSRSATTDVAKLLVKLKAEKVSGIILDLRGNGGGSLQEAIGITGLFIHRGPVVQVRNAEGRVMVDDDDDPSVAYDGPMVVLTNKLSASASEIVAGALQDYGRAVVVGDTSTFGKGTVQAVVELSRLLQQANMQTADDPGTLHLTIQKFYRPGGASTQLKGVVSDLVVPAGTSVLEYGEKFLDNPLPFDTISPSSFVRVNRVAPVLPELKKRSAQRIAKSADFAFLQSLLAQNKKTRETKTVSLNEAERVKELELSKARSKARQKVLASRAPVKEKVYPITLAAAGRPGLPSPLAAGKGPLAATSSANLSLSADDDTDTGASGTPAEKKGIAERDLTLDEAQHILLDYVALTRK